MRTQLTTIVLSGALLLAGTASSTSAAILNENFTPAAGWTKNNGDALGGDAFLATSYDLNQSGQADPFWYGAPALPAPVANQNLLVLGNVSVKKDLGQTLTAGWTMDVHVLSNNFSRAQEMALVDSSGNGYGVMWNTAGAPALYGLVSIVKVTAWTDNSYVNYSPLAESLGNHDVTGYDVTNTALGAVTLDSTFRGFAELTLSRQPDGTLTLWEDGKQLLTTSDTSYTDFSRVVLGGNTFAFYDSLSVAVPEPTLGLLGLASFWILRRRCR